MLLPTHPSPTLRLAPKKAPEKQRAHRRGFTLVELMVALTGGLFVSIVVFLLARDGSRFYQRESRVANATFAVMTGFERLRSDIARAGFLTSPNIAKDPLFCGDLNDSAWPALLKSMGSLQVVQGGSPDNATLAGNGLDPDRIILSGSYSSVDQFPIRLIVDDTTSYRIFLQVDSPPMARIGYSTTLSAEQQEVILSSVFGPGRALRIRDRGGGQHFGTIQSVSGGTQPSIQLSRSPMLRFRSGSDTLCGFKGYETGALANVVNFIQYDIRNLATDSNLEGTTAYAPLYSETASGPFDDDRTELVRVELDTSGNPIAGTEELVAEYAVDLAFGLTVAEPNVTGPRVKTLDFADDTIDAYVGAGPYSINRGPHFVRAVRARLSVRSREADRPANIDPSTDPAVAPGLYRIGLGESGTAPFARVRTLQADIALRNQTNVLWP